MAEAHVQTRSPSKTAMGRGGEPLRIEEVMMKTSLDGHRELAERVEKLERQAASGKLAGSPRSRPWRFR